MVNAQPYQPYYQNYPSYQQYPQPVQTVQPVQPVQNQVLVWVQSEDEATKFPLSSGQSIFLMNQNDNYLYMKSVDQLGKTTFIKKRLVDESDNQENKVDLSGYIRKEELQDILTEMIQKEVEKKVSEVSFKAAKTRRKSSEVN